MKAKHTPLKKLREWVNDVPGGNLYSLFIQDDGSVWSVAGRYSHDSGATSCSLRDFLDGKLDTVVRRAMGEGVLVEAKAYVSKLL